MIYRRENYYASKKGTIVVKKYDPLTKQPNPFLIGIVYSEPFLLKAPNEVMSGAWKEALELGVYY